MKIWPNGENIHPLKRVKWGIDPTGSRLHLGHLVGLQKLKEVGRGREVTIVIGTCTARLGDPTGQNKTRPVLSGAVIKQNAEAIKEQIKRVAEFQYKIVENDSFASKASMMDFLLEISTKFTVAELMERENFKGRGVGLQELLVPLAQAWDSVCLETQIEVGGEDQMINFSLTRQLQKAFGQRPQSCVLLPIIRGTDGRKMSKTYDNTIYIDEPTDIIIKKVMSLSDEITNEWAKLLTDIVFDGDPVVKKRLLAENLAEQLK